MTKKKWFFICLPACFLASALFTCGCGKSDGINSEAPAFAEEALLCSFEDYYDCYDFYYGYNEKFVVDFTDDKQIVTDGHGAISLSAQTGSADTQRSMTVGVPLSDDTDNYRDFSRMRSVTVDVYNASENEATISVSVMQKKIGYMYSNIQSFTLAAKSKQTISYSVNRYEIYYALGIDGPTHVNVNVKGVNPLVYLDNMRLHYTPDEFVAPEAEIGENEIVGFEKAYQGFVTYTTGTVYKAEVVADITAASKGNCYLRVRREGVQSGEKVYAGGKLGVSSNYLNNINFDAYPASSYVAFDYKSAWTGDPLWVVPRLVSVKSGLYSNIQGAHFDCDETWHTFYIPFSFAPLFFDNIEISFDGGTTGDFYFDNFRMESALPDGIAEKYVAQKYTK